MNRHLIWFVILSLVLAGLMWIWQASPATMQRQHLMALQPRQGVHYRAYLPLVVRNKPQGAGVR